MLAPAAIFVAGAFAGAALVAVLAAGFAGVAAGFFGMAAT
jgi:hypothetical protein